MELDWPLVGRERELQTVQAELSSREAAGVVLVGRPGAGKTRLAQEGLARASTMGRASVSVVATRSSSRIFLGALASVLPEIGGTVDLVGIVREALGRHEDGRPPVVFVDDAHLLDETSLSIVGQLIESRDLFLLATVRDSEENSDRVRALWDVAGLRELEIEALSPADTDRLIGTTLRPAVSRPTALELRKLSGGNPFALRELLLSLVENGALARDPQGTWRLVGPVRVSDRLADLVASRFAALTADESRVLELVALGEPIERRLLGLVVEAAAVQSTEDKGLIVTRDDAGRSESWLGHPLYGEVVRANMGMLRSRSLLTCLADAAESIEPERLGDALRHTMWRLDAGAQVAAPALSLAAKQAWALQDFELARRLSEKAWQLEPSQEVGELLAFSLCYLGRFDEADAVLVAVSSSAKTDRDRVALAEIRSEQRFRSCRPAEAMAIAVEQREATADGGWRDVLDAHRAGLELLIGRPDAAAAIVDPILASETSVQARSPAARVKGTALTWDAQPVTARKLHRETLERLTRTGEVDGTGPDRVSPPEVGIQLICMVQAMTQVGQLEEAEQMLAAAWDQTSTQRSALPMAWVALSYAVHQTAAGLPLEALHWAEVSMDLWRLPGLYGRISCSLATAALAMLGRATEAQQRLDELDAIDTPVRLNEASVIDARAWVLAANGELRAARALCLEAAEYGERWGQRTGAVVALHSLARLGDPQAAGPAMSKLCPIIEGDLLHARAEHVEVLCAGDPDRLVGVANRFEQIGSALLAAEAAADAARAFFPRGQVKEAGVAVTRAQGYQSTHRAATPALTAIEALLPLTPRERDTVILAARGRSNLAIARALGVAPRTVDNHLSHCYQKLQIGSRDELTTIDPTLVARPQ